MKQQHVKIVYEDNKITKVIFGILLSEDEFFLTVLASDSTKFRIGKKTVTQIKEISEGSYNK